MGWPTPNDYDEGAENLRHSMSDEELRGGQAALDNQQLPMVWAGSFASVYRINCPATDKSWALKCFTRDVSARQERYRQIAAHLEAVGLPFTVPFVYLERGIQVRGQWFPAVKMEWVEGQTLNRFVEESLEKPKMLQQLLDLWPKLATRLRDAGIAHADLQHGNVLLVPALDGKLALKLIDYDGMYVPSLAGMPSGELGHANYQHPERLRQRAYNADVDRFSHLAIYTAVHCLKSGGQDLWRQFNNDDNLLFRESDYRKPDASTVFQALWNAGNEQARAIIGRLMLACGQRLEEVPWLDEVVVKGRVQPLSREQENRVAQILAVEKAIAALSETVGAAASSTRSPPLPLARIEPATTTHETRPSTGEGTIPATEWVESRAAALGQATALPPVEHDIPLQWIMPPEKERRSTQPLAVTDAPEGGVKSTVVASATIAQRPSRQLQAPDFAAANTLSAMAKRTRPVTRHESRLQAVGKWLVTPFSATGNAFADLFRFLVGVVDDVSGPFYLLAVVILAFLAMLGLWPYLVRGTFLNP